MNNRRKRLLVGESVEVRQLDEGLRGSWHIGCVTGVSLRGRDVRYEHLLDDDGITTCVEHVGVSYEIDGFKTWNGPPAGYRGRIRPLPPVSGSPVKDLCYGFCVDASYEDGWWEGVIFDHEMGSEERIVFFPDEGDELRFNVNKLRVTRDWDEAKGEWGVRGTWAFLRLIDELTNDSGTVSHDWIKQLWYRLRQQDAFLRQISEWTLGEPCLWRKLIKHVSNSYRRTDSTYGNDAVEMVLKDDKSVHKRRTIGDPREQCGKVQRRHHKDRCYARNKNAITRHADSQEGCQALDGFESQIVGNASTELAVTVEGLTLDSASSVVEKSDAPVSFLSLVSVENDVYKDCHNAGSSSLLNGVSLAEKSSQGLADLEKRKASGKNLAGDLRNSLQALVDYATVWKETPHWRRTMHVRDKARQQLKAIGWKIEPKVSENNIITYLYVSPEGKYHTSLINVCEDLISGVVNDSSGIADQEVACVQEMVAVRKSGISNEQLQQDIVGLNTTLIACESDKEPDIEPSTVRPSGEAVGDDVVSGKECSRQAIMEYVRLMDENKKSKGVAPKELVDRVRMKAKEHLLAMGWTFKREPKSKEREELRYFTPQGKRFVSFYVACCAYDEWEEKYGNNHSKCKEDKIASQGGQSEEDKIPIQKDQKGSSQSPDISSRTLLESVGDRLVQSTCVELVTGELDALMSVPPPHMIAPFLEDDAFRDSVDISERRIPENRKDEGQGAQVYSVSGETVSADFVDAADQFLKCNSEQKSPTISECHQHGTKMSLDARSTVLLTSSIDKKRALCPPLSLLNEKVKEISVITGSHDGGLVNSPKGQCAERHKVPKARIYQSPKIKVGKGVCFLSEPMAAEEMTEHGSVIRGQRRGRPPQCRKRKRGRPVKTYLTRSYDENKSLVVPSKSRNMKTTLSWLIDNEVVLPKQKVYYIAKKRNSVMAEGRITGKGILCCCCSKIYSLTNFEAHAGSNNHRPAAHIFLKDGRSLLECQMELLSAKQRSSSISRPFRRMKVKGNQYQSDSICSVCHYGGSLILCDQCPSSFHLTCVNLKVLPKGKWFCPCCRCAICGQSDFSDGNGEFSEMAVMYCDQCQREYHVGCWSKREKQKLESFPLGHWFCSRRCSKIFMHLHKILGKRNSTSLKGLHWTILRSTNDLHRYDASVSETMTEFHSKISLALDVLHECFVPVIEHRTKSDLVADVLFNRSSDLNRLNFEGFYTMVLEKGDELISVATIRIHGQKVAEMPLIGTRVQYRRQGMCRLLVAELESMLSALGVERLILPAASLLRETWIHSFGFTEMTSKERSELLGFTFLNFQDTTMCQRLLKVLSKEKSPTDAIVESGEVRCCDTTNLSLEAVPNLHPQVADTGCHPVGANASESCETSFLREMPEESSLRTVGDHLVVSSSVELRRDEALVDLECRHETIHGKHKIHVKSNRENIANKFAQECRDNLFEQIYRRRCTRVADENIKRIKHTTFCN